MSGKNLLEGMSPVTQTIESGKALAKYLGMNEELPETIALADGARLVLSTKKDCYYTTTPKGCICRAGQYGRMCKHRKQAESPYKMPANYQRMVSMASVEAEAEPLELIHKGGFKPCLPEEA